MAQPSQFPEPTDHVETPEERHQRYVEAAKHGVDIGIDRDFVDRLLRGEHLTNDFLKDV